MCPVAVQVWCQAFAAGSAVNALITCDARQKKSELLYS
jgi:hypothetical protein